MDAVGESHLAVFAEHCSEAGYDYVLTVQIGSSLSWPINRTELHLLVFYHALLKRYNPAALGTPSSSASTSAAAHGAHNTVPPLSFPRSAIERFMQKPHMKLLESLLVFSTERPSTATYHGVKTAERLVREKQHAAMSQQDPSPNPELMAFLKTLDTASASPEGSHERLEDIETFMLDVLDEWSKWKPRDAQSLPGTESIGQGTPLSLEAAVVEFLNVTGKGTGEGEMPIGAMGEALDSAGHDAAPPSQPQLRVADDAVSEHQATEVHEATAASSQRASHLDVTALAGATTSPRSASQSKAESHNGNGSHAAASSSCGVTLTVHDHNNQHVAHQTNATASSVSPKAANGKAVPQSTQATPMPSAPHTPRGHSASNDSISRSRVSSSGPTNALAPGPAVPLSASALAQHGGDPRSHNNGNGSMAGGSERGVASFGGAPGGFLHPSSAMSGSGGPTRARSGTHMSAGSSVAPSMCSSRGGAGGRPPRPAAASPGPSAARIRAAQGSTALYVNVTAQRFDMTDTDITYTFDVAVGPARWPVAFVYDDFAAFSDEITRIYGTASVPRLTGKVWIRPHSTATGQKRLPKLELYLQKCVTEWTEWRPYDYIELPSPAPPHQAMRMNPHVAQFLSLHENLYQHTAELEAQAEADAAQKAAAAAAATADEEFGEVVEEEIGSVPSTPRSDDSCDDPEVEDERQRQALVAQGMTETEAFYAVQRARRKKEESAGVGDGAERAEQREARRKERAAAARKKKAKEEAEKKEDKEDEAGFVVIEDASEAQVSMQDKKQMLRDTLAITAQTKVIIRKYVIVGDRVEFEIHLDLAGHQWTVSKRYSEFQKLHQQLLSKFKQSVQLSLADPKDVWAPAWQKCDEGLATKRLNFFDRYLRVLVAKADSWDTKREHRTELRVGDKVKRDPEDKSGGLVRAEYNSIVFDFFQMKPHVEHFTSQGARAAVTERRQALPASVRREVEQQQQKDRAEQRRRTLLQRQKQFALLRRIEVDDLCTKLREIDDDRDALVVLQEFVTSGYYVQGKTRQAHLEELASKALAEGNMMSPLLRNQSWRNGGTLLGASAFDLAASAQKAHGGSFCHSVMNYGVPGFGGGGMGSDGASLADAGRMSTGFGSMASMAMSTMATTLGGAIPNLPCGVTSKQMCEIAKCFFFNDTRAEAILALTDILCDGEDMKAVFGTLIYDWDKVIKEVDMKLCKKQAQDDATTSAVRRTTTAAAADAGDHTPSKNGSVAAPPTASTSFAGGPGSPRKAHNGSFVPSGASSPRKAAFAM